MISRAMALLWLLSFLQLRLAAFSLPGDVPRPFLGPVQRARRRRLPAEHQLRPAFQWAALAFHQALLSLLQDEVHKQKKITKSLITPCQPREPLNSSITAPPSPPFTVKSTSPALCRLAATL